MFLESSQIGFQQPKYLLGIQRAHTRRPQADYQPLLALDQASRFGDMLLDTMEVIFETHMESTQPVDRRPAASDTR